MSARRSLRRFTFAQRPPHIRVVAAMATVAILLWTAAMPAYGDSWSDSYFGPYAHDVAYINPTMLEFYNPASAEVEKESDLQSGYSGGNICRDLANQPMFQNATTPAWNNVGYEFSSAWDLTQDTYWAGDTLSHDPGGSDYAVDTDADGNPGPMEDYVLDFSAGYIVGRSLTITFTYGLEYNSGGCQNDSLTVYGNLGS